MGNHSQTIQQSWSARSPTDHPLAHWAPSSPAPRLSELWPACWLVERLCEIGAAVDTAQWGETTKLDEEAAEYNEALADLFTAVLVDNGLVEPLVTSEGS